jgi:hypothetical protein
MLRPGFISAPFWSFTRIFLTFSHFLCPLKRNSKRCNLSGVKLFSCLWNICKEHRVLFHTSSDAQPTYVPKWPIIRHCISAIFMILPRDINISRKYWLLVGWEICSQLNHTLQGEKENRLHICLVTLQRQGRSADMLLNVAGKVLLNLKFCFMFLNRKMNYSVCPCYSRPWQSIGNCLFLLTSRRWDMLSVKQ